MTRILTSSSDPANGPRSATSTSDPDEMHPFDLLAGIPRPSVGREAELWTPRTRRILPPSFGASWPGCGRIGLVVPRSGVEAARSAGAEVDGMLRCSIPRRDVVRPEWRDLAPLVARRVLVPLLVDKIPSTSFGASLKNLLVDSSWKTVRGRVFHEAGYVCEICGENDGPVECHEVWRYEGVSEGRWGRQTLVRMLCVCRACHEMFHPGLANVRGRGRRVIERIGIVNGWSPAEADLATRRADRLHAERSRLRWALHLEAVADLGILEIDPSWSMHGSDEILTRTTQRGTSRTRIHGATFRLDGRTF